MKLTPSILELDCQEIEARIKRFIADYLMKTDAKGIVVSLSGGLDSCTTAALSALAVGGSKVLGLILPEKETYNKEDIQHAKLVAKKFHFKIQQCDITPTLKALYNTIPVFDPKEKVCKGNLKARTRIAYVYYYANKLNLIVSGSSDKSETMMGYLTKWGDVAADIYPIMDLYKTQVRKLALYIGVPKIVITKPSTPALWPGQLAETELGIKYEKLDLILYGLEHFMHLEEIAKQVGVKTEIVARVKQRWLAMEHKRQMILTTKLEYRTIGWDFRIPRSFVKL